MPTTTGYSFAEVVLVRFPFTNQSGHKQRPAVVISSSAYQQHRPDVILLAITSQLRQPLGFGEVLIRDWQAANLLKPSLLKPIVFTAERSIIRKSMGQLSAHDAQALRSLLTRLLG